MLTPLPVSSPFLQHDVFLLLAMSEAPLFGRLEMAAESGIS